MIPIFIKPLCTECGLEIEPHTSYIAGIEVPDGYALMWACEHRPQPHAEVILGSNDCLARWALRHPEYQAAIEKLLFCISCKHE